MPVGSQAPIQHHKPESAPTSPEPAENPHLERALTRRESMRLASRDEATARLEQAQNRAIRRVLQAWTGGPNPVAEVTADASGYNRQGLQSLEPLASYQEESPRQGDQSNKVEEEEAGQQQDEVTLTLTPTPTLTRIR